MNLFKSAILAAVICVSSVNALLTQSQTFQLDHYPPRSHIAILLLAPLLAQHFGMIIFLPLQMVLPTQSLRLST